MQSEVACDEYSSQNYQNIHVVIYFWVIFDQYLMEYSCFRNNYTRRVGTEE